MAIEVQVSSVTALVFGEVKEKQIWQGNGRLSRVPWNFGGGP